MIGRAILIFALLSVSSVSAQVSEDELKSKIAPAVYPRLGEMARIEGDVLIEVSAGMVAVLSGNQVLVPAALESAAPLALVQGGGDLPLTYHFLLVDTSHSVTRPVTIPRGNALERVMLRIFHRKTEQVVLQQRCEEGPVPPNDFSISGTGIEIWVFGAPPLCIR